MSLPSLKPKVDIVGDSNTKLSFNVLNNLKGIQLSDLKIHSIWEGSEIWFSIHLNETYTLHIDPYAGFMFTDFPQESCKIWWIYRPKGLSSFTIQNIASKLKNITSWNIEVDIIDIPDLEIQDIKLKFIIAENDDDSVMWFWSEPEVTIKQLLYAMQHNKVHITRWHIKMRN